MSRAVRDVAICREALARLPELALSELRQQWRTLYKFDASPHLSRELLLLAVAYRMQEVVLGGLRPEQQRQLRQIAEELHLSIKTIESHRAHIKEKLNLKNATELVQQAIQWRDA